MRKSSSSSSRRPTISLLHEQISPSSQAVTAQSLILMSGHKLRLTVVSDAYGFQCSARAERWSPMEGRWHNVISIPSAQMKTPKGLRYLPHQTGCEKKHFEADLSELQRLAGLVLL